MQSKFIIIPKEFPFESSHLLFVPFQHPKDESPIILAIPESSIGVPLLINSNSQDALNNINEKDLMQVDSSSNELKNSSISQSYNPIFILQKTIDRPQSWIIGNQIIKDGNCYFLSELDSIFLWISQLKKICQVDENKYMYKSDRDILSQIQVSSNTLQCFLEKDLSISGKQICDTVEEDGEQYYRYSNDKVMNWLQAKLNVILEGINENKEIKDIILKSCGFNPSQNELDQAKLLHALQLLREFVNENVLLPFSKSMNMDQQLYPSSGIFFKQQIQKQSNSISIKQSESNDFIKSMELAPKEKISNKIEKSKPKKKTKVNTSEYKSMNDFFKKK